MNAGLNLDSSYGLINGGDWVFERPVILLCLSDQHKNVECFKGHPPLPFHQVLWKSVDLEVFLLLLQNCTLQYGCHNNIWKLDKMGFLIPHSISFPKMYSSLHPHLNSTSVMQRTTTDQTKRYITLFDSLESDMNVRRVFFKRHI